MRAARNNVWMAGDPLVFDIDLKMVLIGISQSVSVSVPSSMKGSKNAPAWDASVLICHAQNA